MRKPKQAEWLYLDFDSFFASVEQLLEPALRGRPVGIVPLVSNFTSLIAASKEAKAYGLKTGVSVRDARVICPHIILRPARHDVYVKIHHQMKAAIETIVPIYATRSIDEVACRLMHNEIAQGLELGARIKAALAQELGASLTCSIGLAPNELLAKIAAEMHKPDGLTRIQPWELPEALYGLKLTDVPGIARGVRQRLEHCNIFDMQSLLKISITHARAIWGNVEGARMISALNGYVVERPATQRGMFGHSRILEWNCREGEKPYAYARLLTIKAARRLRRDAYFAKRFSLSISGDNGTWWGGEAKLLPAGQDDYVFLEALHELWQQARREANMQRVKKVSVTIYDLLYAHEIQDDLFIAPPETHIKRKNWNALANIIDTVREKHGDQSLYMGGHLTPAGGYAGGKIAFNRIPDMGDF